MADRTLGVISPLTLDEATPGQLNLALNTAGLATAAQVTDLDTRLDAIETSGAPAAASVPWSGVTGTPTTLAGYGITDAASDAELASAVLGLATADSVSPAFVTLADAATITVPTGGARVYNARVSAIAGNRAIAFTGLVNGAQGELRIVDAAGFTLTMPAGSKAWNTVTPTNTAGKAIVIGWSFDGTTLRYAVGKEP